MNRDKSKAPTVVHSPLGISYHPKEKANATADCLEKQFTSHDLCDENHERPVETRVQALLASVDDTPLGTSDTFIYHCLRLSHFAKPWKEA
jgi:hypothetical protein